MPYYELLCLASGRLNRGDLTSVLRKACRAFMDNGGTVTRLVPLGATGEGPRKLAYRIRQNQVSHDTGYFINVCAFASTSTVSEVSRQLKIDERVLRHAVYRRPLLDCLRRIPDVTDTPNISNDTNPSDAEYELQKFIHDFRKDFPDGFSTQELVENIQQEEQDVGQIVNSNINGIHDEDILDDDVVRNSQEESVRDILAQLKGSTPANSKDKNGSDLAWLTDLDKPHRPDGNDSK